ncbi:EAL domain-containing protein [Undibacterium sp. RTI2.1]|uniref:putative bifunctional diguanylate cyclase/phosphodiesterase n=1 Tax=unclassified Undibacterium TaxID=2630295 RepID=UPI002AB4998F|nr:MULTISPECIES: EAL domain-containing protein [unclassified Undibacterium]MDY7540688.1 EAL domain-containing protein [Undibacterium sp. 5I1]MEB0032564.1 EAL domain-containing protein [Undibacterium sp. RTI2.1]MEB0118631.1 EAL domain-containing protein [Undibacterium sp. RTI2.2]MEB0232851.1 EAL domain-containing protein [Undibacterium sp. 10I3]MEB0259728.1 EAL domain-containing protein [Undibacterium sp. 5I1]
MNKDEPENAAQDNHENEPTVPIIKLTSVPVEDIIVREHALQEDEAIVLSREKLASARENTAHLREDAAQQREGTVQAREDVANIREVGAILRENKILIESINPFETDNQLTVLQQANAHLVIASIESQKLVEKIENTKAKLNHLAHHDALTDLPNRMLLQDRLTQAIELAHRQGKQLAVMFIDLDHFKYINDSLGHATGDGLLKSVAKRLLDCVRQSDTISRQGGDEFIVLLPSIEHAEYAALSAKKILMSLELPHLVEQNEIFIGASIGIGIYPDDGDDTRTLLKNADIAMYHAKQYGRNNFKFFEQGMNDRAIERQSIETSLRRALERDEFILHYQPKVCLNTGIVVGVEALIRWQHPERGFLLPGQFISIAEECGLIIQIGRWVLHTACRQAQLWIKEGFPAIVISINTSALELRADDFLKNILCVLRETNVEARYLEIELTESVLIQNADSAYSVLQALSDLGIKLALDDFGTGYSSLSYLRRFPFNNLKIDQSFIRQLTNDPDDGTLVSAVINMGRSLKMCVIAEGIETSEQHDYLLSQRCEQGQGFYLARPMLADELSVLLSSGATLPLSDP